MKLRAPWMIRIAAAVAALLIRAWMATVRYQLVNGDRFEHPADADDRQFIYAFWHESLLAPVKFQARVRVLISKHADGELVAQLAQRLGFGVVRGSSTRGGGGALVAMWHCRGESHLVFHPDGPRGPRRSIQPGVVMIASRTGLPIVPVGIGYSRAWRAQSWDRFALPLPFSRIVFVAAESVAVPPDVDREGLEVYRRLVAERMLQATEDAERRASQPSNRSPNAPHFPRPPVSPREAAPTTDGHVAP